MSIHYYRLAYALIGVAAVAAVAAGAASCGTRLAAGGCNNDGDCPTSAPMCHPTQHSCVVTLDGGSACSGSGDCSDPATPICENSVCRQCAGAGDDAQCAAHSAATPRCGDGHRCAACRADTQATDCKAATKPVCGADGACRACQRHAECPSGVCSSDGSCLDPAQVAYVDNANGTCSATHSGMQGDPYCQITDALAAMSPKAYVVVKGSTTAYRAITIGSGTFTIIGPGRDTTPQATVSQDASPSILMSTTTAAATATLDGLDLIGSGGASRSAGVKCQQGTGVATLTIRNSSIHGSGLAGIDSSGCSLTVDACVISENTGGGITLTNSNYTITNDIIRNNGSTTSNTGGVSISNPPANVAQAELINLTIVDNSAKPVGVYPGLDCATGSDPVVFDTVISSSVRGTVLPAQINPSCNLDHSAYAGGTGTNLDLSTCPTESLFVSPFDPAFDFHPKTTATSPCSLTLVGKGAMQFKGKSVPNKDFFGASRPQPSGSQPDIGAIEVP